MKRSAACTDSEDSESDFEHHGLLCPSLDLPASDGQIHAISSVAEEEGELTPVLETSRADEFDDGQTQKKRRMETERQHQQQSKPANNWADCVDVRMIDFAHTTFSGYLGLDERVHGGPDYGYLLGLDSLTAILSELRGGVAPQTCWDQGCLLYTIIFIKKQTKQIEISKKK